MMRIFLRSVESRINDLSGQLKFITLMCITLGLLSVTMLGLSFYIEIANKEDVASVMSLFVGLAFSAFSVFLYRTREGILEILDRHYDEYFESVLGAEFSDRVISEEVLNDLGGVFKHLLLPKAEDILCRFKMTFKAGTMTKKDCYAVLKMNKARLFL